MYSHSNIKVVCFRNVDAMMSGGSSKDPGSSVDITITVDDRVSPKNVSFVRKTVPSLI